ncbi:hypothetical protein [Microcoleus sp. herbarium12]
MTAPRLGKNPVSLSECISPDRISAIANSKNRKNLQSLSRLVIRNVEY